MTEVPAGRVALVVEGGAMRGIFAAGVLDVFLEQRFRPFDLALGVSVGASNMLSFLAGQHGRTRRCFLDQMSRPEFMDPWRAVRGGHWMDLDWLWDAIEREDPLDRKAAAASGIEYALVATSARTGKPRYLAPGADDMLEALKASCALPVLYRKMVTLDGESFVDGGLSDPIPVREAYRRGARTMVVLRSRAAHFVKNARVANRVGAWAMRGEPALARACRQAAGVYRDAVTFMKIAARRLPRDSGGACSGARHGPDFARPLFLAPRLRARSRAGPRGHQSLRATPLGRAARTDGLRAKARPPPRSLSPFSPQPTTDPVDGEAKERTMATHLEERLAEVRAEIERQDQEWSRARRALAQRGDEPIAISPDLLEDLEALARSAPLPPTHLRA